MKRRLDAAAFTSAAVIALATGCASGGFGKPPEVDNLTHESGDWDDKVTVSFRIRDADCTESYVVMKYSDDGGTTWKPTTLVYASKGKPSGSSVLGLRPSATMPPVTVRWDTWTDGDKVGAGGPVPVRLKLWSYDADGPGGETEMLTDFTVDNLHPILTTDETEIVFPDGVRGLQDPNPQTLTITNAGTGGADLQCDLSVSYLEAVPTNWLTVPASTGTIVPSGFEALTFSADCQTGSIPNGQYHATVTIEDTNAHDSPVEIPVTLVVRNPMAGILIHDGTDPVSELSFDFDETPPPSQTIYVQNCGEDGTQLSWSIDDNLTSPDWLSFLPESRENVLPGNYVPVTVFVVEPSLLPPGEHVAQVTVSGHESTTGEATYTGDQSVIVRLGVAVPPTIVFGPGSFQFYGVYGSADPDAQTLYISNSGDRTLDWTVSSDAAWLTLDPLADTCTVETDQVDVSVNLTDLEATTHTATITVTGTDAPNSPIEILVTLVVFEF